MRASSRRETEFRRAAWFGNPEFVRKKSLPERGIPDLDRRSPDVALYRAVKSAEDALCAGLSMRLSTLPRLPVREASLALTLTELLPLSRVYTEGNSGIDPVRAKSADDDTASTSMVPAP
jgi:hypothetical protein